MEIIQDRANKLFSDAHKKKVDKKASKDDKLKDKLDSLPISDLSNGCFYCHKVFYNPRFLIKHMLHRHSDDILLMYRKFLKKEPNKNSNEIKYLVPYLEKEFVEIRNELKLVKEALGCKSVENTEDNGKSESPDNVHPVSNHEVTSNKDSTTEMQLDELKVLKDKMVDLETNFQSFHSKFEKLDNVLKTEVLSKDDIKEFITAKEKILKMQELQFLELRETLLKDLQAVLSKQINENDYGWKLQVLELKEEVERFDKIFHFIKKQVDSPEYLETLVQKIEHQIGHPQSSSKRNARRRKLIPKTRASKTQGNSSTDGKISRCEEFVKKPIASPKQNQHSEISRISSKELDLMVAEKLSQFGIPPNKSKMSCAEFEEKSRLVNSEKKHLEEKYPNFIDVYNATNRYADYLVLSKLKKQTRKIRFSEPLTSNIDFFRNSTPVDEDIQNKTFPMMSGGNQHCTAANKKSDVKYEELSTALKIKFPVSEGFEFSGVGDKGDCSSNLPDGSDVSFDVGLESTPVKSRCGTKTSIAIAAEDTKKSTSTNETCSVSAEESQKSVSEINITHCSLSDEDAQILRNTGNIDSNKPKNFKSSFSNKILVYDSVERGRNLDYSLKDSSVHNIGTSVVKNSRKNEICIKDCNGDYFDDDESLQSLSSYEEK